MKEKTDKLITLIGLGIAVLAALFALIFAFDIQKNSSMFDIAYWIIFCLVALSIVAIVIFLIVKLAKKFKEEPGYWKKFLLLVVLVVVACVASYLLAKGNDVKPAVLEKYSVSEDTSKLIGAACILVYILVIGACVSIVYTWCSKLFKK